MAIVCVLAFACIAYGLYAYATALPSPSITSAPTNPTNKTTASFAYSDSSSVTFQCLLDGGTFSACGSGKKGTVTYSGPLSAGSHTFKVRAVSGSQTSSATSVTWTIDTTPPQVVSINRAGPSPTNASTVSWTVTFSESVTGVVMGGFTLVVGSGISGPKLKSVSGSGSVYSVTASSGTGTGSMGLSLVDNDAIKDTAGNPLGGPGNGNGSFTGQVYSIDTVAPPRPVITQPPPNPSSSSTVTVAWTDSEAGVSFQCSVDEGPWTSCTSPDTFTVGQQTPPDENGQHEFRVRAVDGVGNTSIFAETLWAVSADHFSIAGDVSGLYPGVTVSIPVAITNPNSYPIQVNQLTVSIGTTPPGCAASWFTFVQSPISGSHMVTVDPNSTLTLSGSDRPQITLLNVNVNQDACENRSVGLTYSGTATHS